MTSSFTHSLADSSSNFTQFECKSISELPEIAQKIISLANKLNKRIWILEGDLGAGKTTFTKAVCAILGVKETVSSPTFALINEYEGNYDTTQDNEKLKLIYHCDFYRINNPSEVLELGIEEYFEKAEENGNYCFIEWASKIEGFLPEQYLRIDIEVNQTTNSRILTVRSL
ncbi:tRNA (adenosine(37)-N6)-threonylcarbamoyltransferase complex ATPase subunit type 1 TsaE [Bernardetia sp. OM2101]|uniref:tRNA (adenosine(37)-N6)-threonylcarbamoyltransferase complex ATPase subunit type 1 TsaE n=1 Tax=Bernardetia sp. OM2101 TaxID=3344876 RepID=UPI0035CFCE42